MLLAMVLGADISLADIKVVEGEQINRATVSLTVGSAGQGNLISLPVDENDKCCEDYSVPTAKVEKTLRHPDLFGLKSVGNAEAHSDDTSIWVKTWAGTQTAGPAAGSTVSGSARAVLEFTDMTSFDYLVEGNGGFTIDGVARPSSGTRSVTEGTRLNFRVTVEPHHVPGNPSNPGGISGRHVDMTFSITKTGTPPKGTLKKVGPNSYKGYYPTRYQFGRTGEYYFSAQAEEGLGSGSLLSGESQLNYSVVENSFASIVIPGEAGGDPLSLQFGSQTEIVQPGSTFNFLPLFPEVTSLSLVGNGLAATSVTGFTFANDGVADITLNVVPPGDFNGDGSYDAADYIVWRKNGGSAGEYALWRANFGHSLFAGGGEAFIESASVPEPGCLALAIFGAMIFGVSRSRTRYSAK